jgi:hypothetical protein
VAKGAGSVIFDGKEPIDKSATINLQWHTPDMDFGADYTAAVLAPFAGGSGDGVGRKRHLANNADVIGRAATVRIIADVVSLYVHQVVRTRDPPTDAPSHSARSLGITDVNSCSDCLHCHWVVSLWELKKRGPPGFWLGRIKLHWVGQLVEKSLKRVLSKTAACGSSDTTILPRASIRSCYGPERTAPFLVHELDADAAIAHVAAVNNDCIAIVVNDVVAAPDPSTVAFKGGDGHDLHLTLP